MAKPGKVLAAGAMCVLGALGHTELHRLAKGEEKDEGWIPRVSAYAPLGILLYPALGLAAGYISGTQPLCGPWTAAEVVSAAAAFGGLALRRWAVLTLRHFFTFVVGVRKDHKLIRTGPYRVIRHPAYTGTILFVVGAYYFVGVRSLVAWLLLMGGVSFGLGKRIQREERVLREAFGKECDDYFRCTWRLVPILF